MRLRVLGCHGGTSVRHRNPSFLLDGRLALDAGSLAAGLDLSEQARVERVLITHAHLDHVADLGSLADLRWQQDGPPLVVAGPTETLEVLDRHLFNGALWPDFRRIETSRGPTVTFEPLTPDETVELGGYRIRPVRVDHSVPACGYLVGDGQGWLAYSGDTGPTQAFWDALDGLSDLHTVVTELSYPSGQEELAARAGHQTPRDLRAVLARLPDPRPDVLLYGWKPFHEERIAAEVAALGDARVRMLRLDEVVDLGQVNRPAPPAARPGSAAP